VKRFVVALSTCTALGGCAFPQSPIATPDGTVLQATTDAMQYRSPLPRDVHLGRAPGEATGVACRTMLAFPTNPPTPFYGSNLAAQVIPWQALAITFGDDGYAAAMARAREAAAGGRLFDVRADVHTTAVLGIWRRECVEVHARVAR